MGGKMSADERGGDGIARRLKAQQDEEHAREEQGSAAKEIQPDHDADRDPEEEGSAGRPQR